MTTLSFSSAMMPHVDDFDEEELLALFDDSKCNPNDSSFKLQRSLEGSILNSSLQSLNLNDGSSTSLGLSGLLTPTGIPGSQDAFPSIHGLVAETE